MTEPTAVFVPSGRRGHVPAGTTVLDAARRFGVDLDSVCGGRGICGRCQVRPAFGEFAKHALTSAPDHLSPPGSTEHEYHGRRPLEAGSRLGCAAQILGDVVLDVPPESQVHRPVVRKSVDLEGLVVDPVVQLHYVEVAAADLGEGRSDLQLLLDALDEQWSLTALAVDTGVLADLQPALADGRRAVTVAVHGGNTVTAVWPGFVDRVYGVAVDVGSTTIAGHLCELGSGEVLATAGAMNPQIRFGEDLMSRVSYVMMNPGGREQLTDAVQQAVDELVGELTAHGRRRAGRRARPGRRGQPDHAPPPPRHRSDAARDGAVRARHRPPRGRPGHRHRRRLPPCPPAPAPLHRRARRARTPPRRSSPRARTAATTCSSSSTSGPTPRSCSGAGAGCWPRRARPAPRWREPRSRAASGRHPGAIERVRIDRDTLEPRYRVVGSDVWSDDPAFEASLPAAGVTGVCGSGIIEVVAELFLSGVLDADGAIDGATADRTPRVVPGRTRVRVRAARRGRRSAGAAHHAGRRPRHPARQGRAAGRRPAAHGPRRAGEPDRRRLA